MTDTAEAMGGHRIRRVPGESQWLLQARAADRAALAAAIGTDLPAARLASAVTGDWAALHLAPDEWLLIAPAGCVPVAPPVTMPCSLVDVSQRSMAIEIAGPEAVSLLSGACGLDLERMAAGDCTRTLFGKITILLWRRPDAWRIGYPRSFDAYVHTLIAAITPDRR